MVPMMNRSAAAALRIAFAGVCCLGIWYSWNLADADYLFQKDTEGSVRGAIHLVPDNWSYYMRLAQLDRKDAGSLLATSLRLNPFDAQANIELGLQYEADGDYARAEQALLAAFAVDHTYLPRWSLANYYYRRANMPAFWTWARSSAEMPADDIGPLFELCWRVSPDNQIISKAVLNDNPETVRQYLGFLLTKDQMSAASDYASRLVTVGTQDLDRPLLFSFVNRLVGANDGAAAAALWRLLINRHWVVADDFLPNNANFMREPLPVPFDWSLPEYPGMHSWPGSSGLQVEFTGSQPEDCKVAEQALVLAPGTYTFRYSYRTTDISAGTGIHWTVLDSKTGTVLADSGDLSSDGVKRAAMEFRVPAEASVLRLVLSYHRSLGTTRITGMLFAISTQIEAHTRL